MIVKFVKKCEITICQDVEDEEGIIEEYNVGDIKHFVVMDHPLKFLNGKFVEDQDLVNVRFDDGSVAFGISKDWYEEI